VKTKTVFISNVVDVVTFLRRRLKCNRLYSYSSGVNLCPLGEWRY